MQQGYFEKEFTLTPDYCDARAGLSPLGAFTIFQAIATEHAENIGVGGAAMAKRGEFKLRTEGYQEGKWIVLDYGDLLIHIFGRDERKYYNIERLWRDPLNSEDYIYDGGKINE